MKKTLFIKNALILTATSLFLRLCGVVFKVWIASQIGSEGIGLYQLVFSVYVLVSTFATSGICTAVTRLISEELALGNQKSCLKILKKAILLSLFIALVSAVAVFLSADFVALRLLGDIRASLSLKFLPVALPFMGVSSCIRGYFIARRKVTPNVISQIFEQIARITIIHILFKKFVTKGLSNQCFSIIFGDASAEALSCAFLVLTFIFDIKNLGSLKGRERTHLRAGRQILHIALPITSGRYLNTLLRTAENVLVPRNLAKYRFGSANALSQFGMIKGMALPILFFPSAILGSVSTLLIPEISEATAKKNNMLIKFATQNIIKLTLLVSFIFTAVFFTSGERIGLLVYGDREVGFLLKALSPIVPLMYLDSISDGLLKGLDQQLFSFRTAISDSSIRIILVLCLLPISGLSGFIGIMYLSNFLTCFLNVKRLLKVTKAKIEPMRGIFLPVTSALFSTFLSEFLLSFLKTDNNLLYIILFCLSGISLYFVLLILSGCVDIEELKLKPKMR